jgi:hypothetical protein
VPEKGDALEPRDRYNLGHNFNFLSSLGLRVHLIISPLNGIDYSNRFLAPGLCQSLRYSCSWIVYVQAQSYNYG